MQMEETKKKAGGEADAVKVAVRVRPFSTKELGQCAADIPVSVISMDGNRVDVLGADLMVRETFNYNETYWSIPDSQKQTHVSKPFATQEMVFQDCGLPAVKNALSGYHACIFAYGQTGSGKTHTMLGNDDDPGISPRIIEHLFEELDAMKGRRNGGFEYSVEISFMEIYNEAVKDLFNKPAEDDAGTSPAGTSRRRQSRRQSGPPGRVSPRETPLMLDVPGRRSVTPTPQDGAAEGLRPVSPVMLPDAEPLPDITLGNDGTMSPTVAPPRGARSLRRRRSESPAMSPGADPKETRRPSFVMLTESGVSSPSGLSPATRSAGRRRSLGAPSESPRGHRTSFRDEDTASPVDNLSRRRSMGRSSRGSLAGVDPETEKLGYKSLRVRHSPTVGIFVDGLQRLGAKEGIHTADDVKKAMAFGMQHRATAATQMNDQSSRSHAIFQICVKAANKAKGVQRYSHINLVDLAGSERVKMSGAQGGRFTEATKINLSLSTLRRVIDALIENSMKKKAQPKVVPPYRDSILTWILSESLGGNSKTLMIATVSPAESNREDSINTLRYAFKAKSIVNTVRVNEQKTSVVLSSMMGEIETMRRRLVEEELGEESHHHLKQEIETYSEEYMKMQEQSGATLQEMEQTRQALEATKEEISAKKAEVQRLQEEGIEEKHKEQQELHDQQTQRVEGHRIAVEELRQKERDVAAIQERERLEKEELKRQKLEVEYREELYRQEMLENKRKQFALAFNKAFKNTHNTSNRELLAREIALTNERISLATHEHHALLVSVKDLSIMNDEYELRIREAKERATQTEQQKIQSEHHSTASIRRLQEEKQATDDALNIVKSEHSRVTNNSFIASERRAKEAHMTQERHRHAAARLASAKTERMKKQTLLAQLAQQQEVLREEIGRLTGRIDDTTHEKTETEDTSTALLRECAHLREANKRLSAELGNIIDEQGDASVQVSKLSVQELALRHQLDDIGLNHDDLRHFVSHRFFPSSSPFAGLTSAYSHASHTAPATPRPQFETKLDTFQHSPPSRGAAPQGTTSPSGTFTRSATRTTTTSSRAHPAPHAGAGSSAAKKTPRSAASATFARSGTYTAQTSTAKAGPKLRRA